MTFSETPIEPQTSWPSEASMQHARRRAGAVRLVEDADLVVDELDVGQVRVDLADRVAQRAVERVDRAVALGGADVALAVDPDLDRRLGLDLAVGALLDDHAPGLEPEERLVVAGLAAQEQLERAVGGLELVAARARAALTRSTIRVAASSSTSMPGRLGLLGDRPAAGELGDEHARARCRRAPGRCARTSRRRRGRRRRAARPCGRRRACRRTAAPGSGARLSSSSTKCAVSVSRASCSSAEHLDGPS